MGIRVSHHVGPYLAVAAVLFADAAIGVAARNYGAYLSPNLRQDPNNLHILTPYRQYPGEELGQKLFYPRSTIMNTKAMNSEDAIIDAAVNYAKTHATLDELTIGGHGNSNEFTADGEHFIQLDHFLDRLLAKQQQLNMQIARRIVFLGCAIFTDLTPQWVRYYQGMAHALNTEIVAPTTLYTGSLLQAGRMARFRPDGVIDRDKYDRPYSVSSLIAEIGTRWYGLSSAWFEQAETLPHQHRLASPPLKTKPASAVSEIAEKSHTAIRSNNLNPGECIRTTCESNSSMIPQSEITVTGPDINGWRQVETRAKNGLLLRGYAASNYLTIGEPK